MSSLHLAISERCVREPENTDAFIRSPKPREKTADAPTRLAAQPMPRRLAILVAALSALFALAAAPEAPATIKGPCTGRIAGQDVAPQLTGPLDDAVKVHKDDLVSVTMSSEQPLTRLKVELEFAGQRWTVHERPTTGTSWVSEVPVDDYALYGIGLYKIVASSEGQGFTCTGTALVSVEGDNELDPLKTVAGIAGFMLALFGLVGVLAVAARVGKARSAPFLGILAGAVLGVGAVVLLQQFSIVYPTVGVTGGLVAIGAALGLAFSLFGLPTRSSDARNVTRG